MPPPGKAVALCAIQYFFELDEIGGVSGASLHGLLDAKETARARATIAEAVIGRGGTMAHLQDETVLGCFDAPRLALQAARDLQRRFEVLRAGGAFRLRVRAGLAYGAVRGRGAQLEGDAAAAALLLMACCPEDEMLLDQTFLEALGPGPL